MNNIVRMPPLTVLLSIAYIEALAEAIRGLNLSRRRTIDWLVDVLLAWAAAGGVILDWDGNAVIVDDALIDQIYGEDASCTGPSTLKRIRPGSRRRAPRHTTAMRLGLYDAALRISGKPIVITD